MSILHSSGPIVRVDDYYPAVYPATSGRLTFNTSQYSGALTNKYLFNGNEFIDSLGMNSYDFHARVYDPALGRFMRIDPLAENTMVQSPYQFANNNPILFNDPTGMKMGVAQWALDREEMLESNGWHVHFGGGGGGGGSPGGSVYTTLKAVQSQAESKHDLEERCKCGDAEACQQYGFIYGTTITDKEEINFWLGQAKELYPNLFKKNQSTNSLGNPNFTASSDPNRIYQDFSKVDIGTALDQKVIDQFCFMWFAALAQEGIHDFYFVFTDFFNFNTGYPFSRTCKGIFTFCNGESLDGYLNIDIDYDFDFFKMPWFLESASYLLIFYPTDPNRTGEIGISFNANDNTKNVLLNNKLIR